MRTLLRLLFLTMLGLTPICSEVMRADPAGQPDSSPPLEDGHCFCQQEPGGWKRREEKMIGVQQPGEEGGSFYSRGIRMSGT